MKKFSMLLLLSVLTYTSSAFALSSPNIPLDSQIYLYLEKLSGFGLISDDVKGIRPYSRSEAVRLLRQAEGRLDAADYPVLAGELVQRIKDLLPRETELYGDEDAAAPFDLVPISSARLRYVYLDGAPRSYFRAIHEGGNDGVFGIGSGLRPSKPYPSPTQQRGTEGTPLSENNNGLIYRPGSNIDLRASSEAHFGASTSILLEPMILYSERTDETSLRVERGYVKFGGEGLELEVGRDENWLGPGYRGAITLTNNARNFDLIKISSPEIVKSKYLWDLKYSLIFSRFEKTVTNAEVRQPFLFAAKIAFKPTRDIELGINLGRQVAGPGVKNGLGDTARGLIGGWNSDNSNSVAGADLRFRFPSLRNSEVYGEFSGEDAAAFWPIVESYVAGIYIPRLTAGGRDDLRFEYFLGHEILYTNGTFPEGYLRYDLPLGHSQGGGVQEFFLRYSHWFFANHNLALEAYHTRRGDHGRVTVDSTGRYNADGVMQAIERKNALRAFWNFPVHRDWNAQVMYGHEWIDNLELRQGESRSNHLFRAELSYKF